MWRLRAVALVFMGLPVTACTGKNPGANDNQNHGSFCGNGLVEPNEICDGSDLAGETCQSLGRSGGTLYCQPDCQQFDTTGCSLEAVCGNDLIEPPEMCDGSSLSGKTCADFEYYSGALACLTDCTGFDTSGCTEYCGDGMINGSEVCDGTDFGDHTCQSHDFYTGSLSCQADCQVIDDSSCTGYCGDGAVNGSEACDGMDFDGDSCQMRGFYSGHLSCLASCQVIDDSGCAGEYVAMELQTLRKHATGRTSAATRASTTASIREA